MENKNALQEQAQRVAQSLPAPTEAQIDRLATLLRPVMGRK